METLRLENRIISEAAVSSGSCYDFTFYRTFEGLDDPAVPGEGEAAAEARRVSSVRISLRNLTHEFGDILLVSRILSGVSSGVNPRFPIQGIHFETRIVCHN